MLRSCRRKPLLACLPLLGAALVAPSSPAHAEPQGTVGLTVGAAGEGYEHEVWRRRTAFHLGLHGDILFGRSNTGDFGVGPFVELLTHNFDEVEAGAGVSGLLPVNENFPLVVSLGGYGRAASGAPPVQPGVSGQVFWGTRGYNFHSKYMLSGGLFAQMRYGLGASGETAIVIGAQLDVILLAMPVLFLVTAARGLSREATPVTP